MYDNREEESPCTQYTRRTAYTEFHRIQMLAATRVDTLICTTLTLSIRRSLAAIWVTVYEEGEKYSPR
jgi:hypothetical protein